MEPIAVLQADLLDILFKNRNKEYGHRLCSGNNIVRSGFSTNQTIRRPPAIPHAAKPVVQQALNPIIVTTEIVEKPLPDNATIVDGPVGPEQSGVPGDGPQPAATAGAGAPSAINSAQSPVHEKVFEAAERMPEFPGGMEALSRFRSRNLQAPDGGNDESVRVLARFIVNRDGFVTACEITTSGRPAFDREVLRVIHKMPSWKPGVQLNRLVSVYYRLPVQFNFQA